MNITEKKAAPVKESSMFLGLSEHYLEKAVKDREEKMEQAAVNEKYSKQMREVFQNAGFDLAAIEKIEAEQQKDTEAFLQRVRPALANRKPDKSAYLKIKSDYEKEVPQGKYRIVQPTEAFVVKSGAAALEEEGEHGWIFPVDPSEIKIKDTASGSGWGWPGQASTNPAATAVVRFSFKPDATGLWNLCPIIAFEGYFIIRANDTWWTSKSARVTVKATVEVKQYNHRETKHFTVLDRGGQDVNRFEFVRTTEYFDFLPPVLLRAEDDVDVKVTIEINSYARGGGSFAEINFEAGQGNYILPALMLSNPV